MIKFILSVLLVSVMKIAFPQNIKPNKHVSFSKYLISSTVKLENVGDTVKDGKLIAFESTGTAFYYLFQIDKYQIPVLVTSYHVVQNTSLSRITFTKADTLLNTPQKGQLLEYDNLNNQNKWIKHPKYDLAILPLNPIMETIRFEQKSNIYFVPFDETVIPKDSTIASLSAIETLLMIGYPKGYWDAKNNYPIVRRGTTATPLFSDFNNRNEFLLDIPIYSGSSGSPVVLFNEGFFTINGKPISGDRLYLLGIAVQSIDLKAQDKINNSTIENPLNIAVVVKASALEDFKPILSNLINSQQNFIKYLRNNNKRH